MRVHGQVLATPLSHPAVPRALAMTCAARPNVDARGGQGAFPHPRIAQCAILHMLETLLGVTFRFV